MSETHEPQAGPVVKVARDLSEIERLHQRLEGQAVAAAGSKLMPGGYAMVALGDVGSRRAQDAYVEALEAAWWNDPDTTHKERPDVSHLSSEDDEWEPPLQTLLWWSEERRERYGYPLDGRRATIATEVAFLRWALDAMWRDEPQWEDFADDVNLARRRLEDTLHAGMRQERTRVPCDRPTCEKRPRLIRVCSPARVVGYHCRACGHDAPAEATHCPNPWCWAVVEPEPVKASDEKDDRHKCPSCKHWFTDDEYQRAYAKQLQSKGAERFVPVREAIATLATQGRNERLVRKWLAAEDGPTLAWEAHTWRRMVWWPELWTKHLTTPTRRRDAA